MTNRPGVSKYFIAIVPPQPVYEEALKWKEFFKTNFNTKTALRSPPHITLHMPFEWRTAREEILTNALTTFSQTCTPFDIELQDFGCFSPRVIFIKVLSNPMLQGLQAQLVQSCKSELGLFNANRLDLPYHPHLTVAFRDLKKSVFPKAWSEVEHTEFRHHFSCNNLALLKHNEKLWGVRDTFSFS